jgi:cell wall-associated NlpC family hydrolase
MSDEFDKRLHAFRPDLADKKLEGKVEAAEFVEGELATICVPSITLRSAPDKDLGVETEALFGEEIYVFEQTDGWAWIQLLKDNYVGYVPESAIAIGFKKISHIVLHPRTFLYPEANMKKRPLACLSMGSRLDIVDEVEGNGIRFLITRDGQALVERHCRHFRAFSGPDYVNHAGRLLETPYRWGGSSAFGIDCSGLVQLCMFIGGEYVKRDSDMQAKTIGEPIDPGEDFQYLQRGDLIFWDGHVAIVEDNKTIIHANGYTMSVAREPLLTAIKRIAHLYGQPTLFRRP